MLKHREGETLHEYKDRVMDPISPTFCAAKWLNSTIWLGQGRTASCHHPPMHAISLEEIQTDPSALHNTRHKKAMRQLMKEGHRPEECEYCWRIEDIGKDHLSDRTYKTLQFEEADVQALAGIDPATGVTPRTLEVAFDRTCQFACSYCSAAFSTTWVKDIRAHGPYEGIVSDDRKHFASDAKYAQPYGDKGSNPFIDAWWRWWPELSQTLEEIRITGGEPLMSTDVWKLLDWFQANPDTSMRFGINSNLGAKRDILDRLIEQTKNLKHFEIFTSCEAHGAQAEYIRDGMDYPLWLENMDLMLAQPSLTQMNIMMTVNALCLFSFTDFLDDVVEMKKKHGRYRLLFSANILRHPSFQSVLVLPYELRAAQADRIETWMQSPHLICEDGWPYINDFEREHLQRLINYLRTTELPSNFVEQRAKMENDFLVFHQQYDARRGKNFMETFPAELVEWFNNLKKITND